MKLQNNFFTLAIYFFSLTGCQIGYLIRTSYDHLSLLSTRISVEKALQSSSLTDEQKKKIELTQEVRQFSFTQLGLKKSENYTHFVLLDRPYVTYAVMASYKWKFEPYLWNFPIIGKAPYKGYYNKASALEEARSFKEKDFDVFVRGVSAFSTLGKLNDPLLSSMLNYSEHNLVNTIIHELTHTTLFIKDNIDFNERLAVFVANKGTELFYTQKEGHASKTLQLIKNENEDDQKFSEFITAELNQLRTWYNEFDSAKFVSTEDKEKIRQERFELIRVHFKTLLKPRLKARSYIHFAEGELNNARLGIFQTYMKNLDDFEKVYLKNGSKISLFLEKCKELNSVEDPEKQLQAWAAE